MVSCDIAYGDALTLGRMADALDSLGLSASVYPLGAKAEAPFVMPKVAPTVRVVLYALAGWAQEHIDDELGAAVEEALKHLKTLENEGHQRDMASHPDRQTVPA